MQQYFERNKFPKFKDIIEQSFGFEFWRRENILSYIRDMTIILLDEIDMAEKLLEYSQDKAQGEWFTAKASDLINQIESDFQYYVEVTEIKKKISSDKAAASVYLTLRERIDRLKSWG